MSRHLIAVDIGGASSAAERSPAESPRSVRDPARCNPGGNRTATLLWRGPEVPLTLGGPLTLEEGE